MPWEKQFREEDACDRIMQAFWARGYQATSMQDLVDATGVNRGSLYATFGNKRSIFLTVLRLYDDRMRRKLLSELEGRCSPREAIRRLFDGIVAQAAVEKENRWSRRRRRAAFCPAFWGSGFFREAAQNAPCSRRSPTTR